MILTIEILKPGLLSTIQDRGRTAYREFGIPESGPMDTNSAQLANRILGNPRHNPVIEFTLLGPEMVLKGQGNIALTGSAFDAKLDQKSLTTGQVIPIDGTHRLSVGRLSGGCRGYLGVAGQWNLSQWLGSSSTAPQNPGQLTPDCVIKKGAVIEVASNRRQIGVETHQPNQRQTYTIRILAGPEYGLFRTNLIKQFLSEPFTISNDSNRMGYRLKEWLRDYQTDAEIISSAVVPGTIQVTHSGQLIILMKDAQTTGGYPRIANVITADLSILGQKRPGDQLAFKLVSLEDAYAAAEK